MNIDRYHPIRQRMIWVAIVTIVVNGLMLLGFGAEVLQGWATWVGGILNLLVIAGVLTKGTTDSEKNTKPLDDHENPLDTVTDTP